MALLSQFSKVQIDGAKAAPDRIYYNAGIINNTLNSTKTADDPLLRFSDSRQTALVPDVSNYEVSVENFSLNGVSKYLPLFIPQIKNTQVDVNETVYEVTVGIFQGGAISDSTKYKTGKASVIWYPDNQAPYTIIPTTSNSQQEVDYYFCYTYSHMVQLINNALKRAWTLAGGGVSGVVPGTQCPFMEFDETTGLFSLNQDGMTSITPYGTVLPQPFNSACTVVGASNSGGLYGVAGGSAPTNYGEYSFVGWNTCLDQLLSNFPTVYYGYPTAWAGAYSGLNLPEIVVDTGLPISLRVGTIPATNADSPVGLSLKTKPSQSSHQLFIPNGTFLTNAYMCRLTQDFKSTGGVWSPIASLVLATTQIPVRNESNANPVTFGSANVGSGVANSGSFQKVLIETPINAVTADLWRGWILYEPLVPTYSSLDPSQDAVQDVDVNLFWRSRLTNSLIPVHIPNQSTMNFRLMFKKKGTK